MTMQTYDEVVTDGQRVVSLAIIAIAAVALLVYALIAYHPEADPGNPHRTIRTCGTVQGPEGPSYECQYERNR